MRIVLFITRQLLISVLLLQMLNLSICSESYFDTSGYTTSAAVSDPTESIVEWVVEWKMGNQDRFAYTNSVNLKGLSKNFCWHIDMQHGFPVPITIHSTSPSLNGEITGQPPSSAFIGTLYPPPRC